MERKDIESLEIYQMAMEIGDIIWDIVIRWDTFAKNSFGYQLVKSVDSIAANISEGYGRFFYKENRQFCYIARGSLYETNTWIKKAATRQQISNHKSTEIKNKLDILLKKLNAYIKYIEKQIEK